MALKRKITFDLNKRGDLKENLPIRMRITYAGKRLDIPMGFTTDLNKWDTKMHRVTNGYTNKYKQSATDINRYLSEQENAIDKIFMRFELDDTAPTLEQVKEAYYNIHKSQSANSKTKQTEPTLFERFEEFIKDQRFNKNWSLATIAKFQTVKSHLLAFDGNLTFTTLDEAKLAAYIKFLLYNKDMRNSSVSKHIKFLKWFLRWATEKGYNSQIAYISFKLKLKSISKQLVFLTWEELMHLYTLEIPQSKQYLERVRDVFCFCCFSSLRYGDAYKLQRSDIKNDKLYVTTEKTNDSLVIDLNKYSRAILEKYKDIPYENNKALPVISNQKMNEYLKELGQLAEFNEPIKDIYYKGNERHEIVYPKYALLGTHAGRRTFVCISLELGIPPTIVMKWTGHSDYKAMQPYIGVSDKAKEEAMKKFDEK